jgi:hypothetical protein
MAPHVMRHTGPGHVVPQARSLVMALHSPESFSGLGLKVAADHVYNHASTGRYLQSSFPLDLVSGDSHFLCAFFLSSHFHSTAPDAEPSLTPSGAAEPSSMHHPLARWSFPLIDLRLEGPRRQSELPRRHMRLALRLIADTLSFLLALICKFETCFDTCRSNVTFV